MKLKKYLENFDNYLNEVSVTGGTGTFVGRGGQDKDIKLFGPFYPTEELKQDLRNQILKH